MVHCCIHLVKVINLCVVVQKLLYKLKDESVQFGTGVVHRVFEKECRF